MLPGMAERSRAVLITGCSTGIGRATALRLARAGWPVYATARSPAALADLRQAGAHTLALDVTDGESMETAVREVCAAEGAVGVLVNNAGYSQSGALETVPIDAVRRQFETNVFGPLRMAQLVLPGMRAQRWGRIVNVGSMGGRLVFPGGGAYHATKYALEAVSDALRFEVAGFGVAVTLLEPGLITTEFGNAAKASVAATQADADGGDPYADFNTHVAEITAGAYEGPMRRLGGGPDRVAAVIERTIARSHPPSRVVVTPSARMMIGARRLLGDRLWDAAMRMQFPQPR
jgi:NAD(P)-dependent dehydrogenase (short-subunit alcohol dehydrogenase family)